MIAPIFVLRDIAAACMTRTHRFDVTGLCCPITKLPLRLVSLAEARRAIGSAALVTRSPEQGRAAAIGETAQVLLRADDGAAYPVAHGHPILLGPEVLCRAGERPNFDLSAPQYDEAYSEMEYYN